MINKHIIALYFFTEKFENSSNKNKKSNNVNV